MPLWEGPEEALMHRGMVRIAVDIRAGFESESIWIEAVMTVDDLAPMQEKLQHHPGICSPDGEGRVCSISFLKALLNF
jgi:hypothetical protein